MKFLIFTLLGQLAGFSGPSSAQETNPCNVKTFAKIYFIADKAPDEKKARAIAELKIARAKMAEEDEAACSAHLTNASDMVTAK
jgi:hypothetical protein